MALMTRRKNIVDFRRRHRIEKSPTPPKPLKQRPWWCRIGSRTNDMWGPYYWPYGLRTWMLITGLGSPIVIGIAWANGWTAGWL